MKLNVLDKGYIELVDKLGDDLTPVNAARVSFGDRSEKFTKKDKKLSKFLITHKHFSPFRHQHAMLIIKAPEFVMRQWYKHIVGIETTSSSSTKDHAWNEISGRYVEVKEYYIPEVFRQQSGDNKQATEGAIENQEEALKIWNDTILYSQHCYQQLLEIGVGKEQARAILPLNQYTKIWWTASFQSIMNFIDLRNEKTAQWEIQQYAKVLKKIMLKIFPETTEIWEKVYWNEN